jgi:hypothetical protein
MSAGISRVHGYAGIPSQRPSTISFFNLNVPGNLNTNDTTTVNGALDQIFRTAVGNFATVALIGTPVVAGSTSFVNFAIEDTGTLSSVAGQTAPSGLGLGSGETESNDPFGGNTSTTALALQGVIQALGTVNGFNLALSTVTSGVVATSSVTL